MSLAETSKTTTNRETTLYRGFLYGLRQSVSIMIGYAPVAVTFGILAAHYGIKPWEIGLMSLFVFAGASQFIAIEMIHQGATAWMIGLTTLIVNIRHVLMSLSMVPYFPERTLPWSLGLAQGLTDETFVLSNRVLKDIPTEEQRRRTMWGINTGAFTSWVVFTVLGGLVGQWLPVQFSGFQFALLSLFIILTVSSLTKKNLATYLLAGFLAVVFKLFLPGKIYLILSVLLAAGIGAFWQNKNAKNVQ